MKTLHPKLAELLQKHGIDQGTFLKKGRPRDMSVKAKREAIVTELHLSGHSWAEMIEITGLTNGSIQRLTKAKGCPAVQAKRAEMGRKAGKKTKGKRRVWLSEQMRQAWSEGKFDSQRGRVRPEEERARLRAGWTGEKREAQADRHRVLWQQPDYREHLLTYHRSDEERVRRSKEQSRRMKDTPLTYIRGRAERISTPKGLTKQTWVRSSYEVAAVRRLESDPAVISYEYEPRMVLPNGRWTLPDFLVQRIGQVPLLLEVKACWVLKEPESSPLRQRLSTYQAIATQHGWDFAVWTEKELKDDLQTRPGKNPIGLSAEESEDLVRELFGPGGVETSDSSPQG